MPSQILSDFHFSVDRGRRQKSGEESVAQLHTGTKFEDSIFFRCKTEFIDLPPSVVLCYAYVASNSSAFGRISLMRDDGGDNSDEERKRGRKMRRRSNERGNKDEKHKKQME